MPPTAPLVVESTVSELVIAAMERKGMSTRDVADATDGRVSHSHVGRICRAEFANPRPETMRALSQALGIPMAKLRKAVGASSKVPTPFVLPERANELNVQERRLIVNMIGALLAAHDSRPE